MGLRDLLNAELNDAHRASQAARDGVSLTGLSGMHHDVSDPIYGERVDTHGMRGDMPADNAGPAAVNGRQRLATAQAQRTRKPFGGGELQMSYPRRLGFRRYWFNDTPGRLTRAREAGYEHVSDSVTGKPVMLVVGRQAGGHELRSYLLEIPERWYFEDMGVQQAALERHLRDIRTGRAGPGSTDNRYVPQRGISFGSQRTA